MLGDRGGKKIEGFDLGNSPLSVTKKVVNGKRLFMSTTTVSYTHLTLPTILLV